jgi:hypothetical protein
MSHRSCAGRSKVQLKGRYVRKEEHRIGVDTTGKKRRAQVLVHYRLDAAEFAACSSIHRNAATSRTATPQVAALALVIDRTDELRRGLEGGVVGATRVCVRIPTSCWPAKASSSGAIGPWLEATGPK